MNTLTKIMATAVLAMHVNVAVATNGNHNNNNDNCNGRDSCSTGTDPAGNVTGTNTLTGGDQGQEQTQGQGQGQGQNQTATGGNATGGNATGGNQDQTANSTATSGDSTATGGNQDQTANSTATSGDSTATGGNQDQTANSTANGGNNEGVNVGGDNYTSKSKSFNSTMILNPASLAQATACNKSGSFGIAAGVYANSLGITNAYSDVAGSSYLELQGLSGEKLAEKAEELGLSKDEKAVVDCLSRVSEEAKKSRDAVITLKKLDASENIILVGCSNGGRMPDEQCHRITHQAADFLFGIDPVVDHPHPSAPHND